MFRPQGKVINQHLLCAQHSTILRNCKINHICAWSNYFHKRWLLYHKHFSGNIISRFTLPLWDDKGIMSCKACTFYQTHPFLFEGSFGDNVDHVYMRSQSNCTLWEILNERRGEVSEKVGNLLLIWKETIIYMPICIVKTVRPLGAPFWCHFPKTAHFLQKGAVFQNGAPREPFRYPF